MRTFRKLLILITFLAPTFCRAASVSCTGTSLPVIELDAEKSSGLNKIFVAYDLKGLRVAYRATSSQSVAISRYSSLGGGYAEPVAVTREGNEYVIDSPEGDMGYIVEEGTDRYYFWLVDYSKHRLYLRGISAAPQQECTSTHLLLQGEGAPIHYYSINGRQLTLSQEIELTYTNQEWDEEAHAYQRVSGEKILDSFSENVYLTPPVYADTPFNISGDRFLREWHWLQQAESETVNAYAVDVNSWAEQAPVSDDPDYRSNIINAGDDGGLGGSAPADITFYSAGTDAVIHHEWQFASDPDFEYLTYRFNEPEVNYVFREQGTTYVRYVGSNADGSCEAYGETFTVNIGASELKCPNAFSPGASEGVNDEWKVSYRSLVEFECHIFNRQGQELFSTRDPQQGWDGKHGGKVVKPGVYFYVITATGADGKQYKESGDINIINYRGSKASQGTVDSE